MGLIQSMLCTVSYCVERIITWLCGAFLLVLLLFTIVMLMIYGISVGYHYAQKELAAFAYNSRSTTEAGSWRRAADITVPPVSYTQRFQGTIEQEHTSLRGLEVYMKKTPHDKNIFWDTGGPPVDIKPTRFVMKEFQHEMPTTDLTQENQLARRLLGRIRRARKNTEKNSFLRHLKRRHLVN